MSLTPINIDDFEWRGGIPDQGLPGIVDKIINDEDDSHVALGTVQHAQGSTWPPEQHIGRNTQPEQQNVNDGVIQVVDSQQRQPVMSGKELRKMRRKEERKNAKVNRKMGNKK